MKFLTTLQFPQAGRQSSNRVALAPMTNQQSHPDGRASDDEIKWLASRAEGGFGITITSAAHIHLGGQGWPGEMGIFADHLVAGLKNVAAPIARAGSLGIVQLYHGGARAPMRISGHQPVSASAWPVGATTPDGSRELGQAEIHELVVAFAAGAERAWQAGFAGVEIHGAHGYLITQFLDQDTNLRHDEYGGTIAGRGRFLLEIIKAIRQRVPRSFLVGVRLSPESTGQSRGLLLTDTFELCDILVDQELDFVHMSVGQFDRLPNTINEPSQPLVTLLAKHLRQRLPMIVAGGIVTPQDAERAMDLGADAIALGRIAIGNPDWPKAAARSAYQPQLWPYSKEHLRNCHLGESFVEYMTRWPGFVS